MNIKKVDYSLIYKIDSEYLENRGEILCDYIDSWLGDNGYFTNTYTFVVEDSMGDLIVDYIDSKHIENCDKRLSYLVEKVLNKFEISYIKEQ